MKLALATVAAVAALTSAPAFAADITGARVEGVIGYDSPNADFQNDLEDAGLDSNLDGVVYGLGLGYDFAVSPTIALGVDAEITGTTADLEVSEGTRSASIEFGRDLYAGGRITAAVSDKFNLYGKIGYTNARVKETLNLGGVPESESGNLDGVRLGVGGQYAVAGNTYAGLEYRYSNYEAGLERHQVAATLGFRF